MKFHVRSGKFPHIFLQLQLRFSYALPLHEQTIRTQPPTFTMADSGSSNRDGKRKWDNGGDRRRGRGGGSMQHGSRPNKKRNMGRKEHA
jgi:hypothetical protein